MTTAKLTITALVALSASVVVLLLVQKSPPKQGQISPTASLSPAPNRPPQGQARPARPPRVAPAPVGSEAGPDAARLTTAQIESFLEQNHRNVDSLLAAYLGSGNVAYLKEAAERYPGDPKVQLKVLTRDLFPDQRRQWLERFKQSAPDNALPFYCSAQHYYNGHRSGEALKELTQAHAKPELNDFNRDYIQCLEELYGSTGLPSVLAKVAAMQGLEMQHLGQMKELARQVSTHRQQCLAAGAPTTAATLAEAGLRLGQRFSGGNGGMTLINQLVGIAIEKSILGQLEPTHTYDALGKTVQQRQAELAQLQQELRSMAAEASQVLTTTLASGNEADGVNYFNRFKINGEYAAMKWFRDKSGGR
jgi:hypothetical protein